MQIGVILPPQPGRATQLARLAEGLGFASLRIPDSQNLAPEVWGQLMLAASVTSRIDLGPGVTNSVTRDPAVTASAALALQVESKGRAVVGIGRGDSAVQRINKPTDRVRSFAVYVKQLRDYLHGEKVDRDGFASRLEWRSMVDVPDVPVEITATGPRMIALAGELSNRVALAVGADPTHVGQALESARDAARRAGRDLSQMRFGAYVNCVIHRDRAQARNAVRGTVATFARFSAFVGSDLTRLPPQLRPVAEYLRENYDMRHHTQGGADHARGLEDRFIDWFAIVGPREEAITRFHELAALGLDFCHVVPGSAEMGREAALASLQAIATEIVPAVA